MLAGVATSGSGWLGYHVNQGHINWGGSHRYDREYFLGPVHNFGSAEEFFDALRTQPNGRFPMTRIDGIFSEGSTIGLRVANEKTNFVRVENITDCSMLLATTPEHRFKGTAEHSVRAKDGNLLYRIKGKGPKEGGEHVGLQIANVAFADTVWPMLLPRTPTAEEVDYNRSIV